MIRHFNEQDTKSIQRDAETILKPLTQCMEYQIDACATQMRHQDNAR